MTSQKKIFLNSKLGAEKIYKGIVDQIVPIKFLSEEERYNVAVKYFEDRETVSTPSLQFHLQIPFSQAFEILERMISEGFCEAQTGAWPCKIIKTKRIKQS